MHLGKGASSIIVTVSVFYDNTVDPVVPIGFRYRALGINGNAYKLDVSFKNDPNPTIPSRPNHTTTAMYNEIIVHRRRV